MKTCLTIYVKDRCDGATQVPADARAALAGQWLKSLDPDSEVRRRHFMKAGRRGLKRLREGIDLGWAPAASGNELYRREKRSGRVFFLGQTDRNLYAVCEACRYHQLAVHGFDELSQRADVELRPPLHLGPLGPTHAKQFGHRLLGQTFAKLRYRTAGRAQANLMR